MNSESKGDLFFFPNELIFDFSMLIFFKPQVIMINGKNLFFFSIVAYKNKPLLLSVMWLLPAKLLTLKSLHFYPWARFVKL